MKKLLLVLLLFITVNSFAQLSFKDMAPLLALKGKWESQRKKGILVEQWTVVNDSTMIGYNYLKTAADSIPQEKVDLYFKAGNIVYAPTTSGQNNEAPVAFKMYKTEGGKYFFQNREHDFPQLITYHLIDNNILKATISGPMNGEERTIHFDFKRIE